jgi:N-acetylglucosaminyl-diphospho-decaprenol L-rhamnosyltransferase
VIAPEARPVTVAVVSWNTRELLSRCLASLAPLDETRQAETWVVDNASEDGSADLVRERFPWVRLIALDENVGFGPAINLVAEQTQSRWIGVANADIEFLPGSLERLLEVGEQRPETGIVAPRLVLPDGSTQHSVYRFPTLPFTLAFNLGLWRLSRAAADRMALEGYWDSERAGFVDWAIGAFVLVRRQAWAVAEGFDPAQWMYAEDLDLGWRVAAAGFRTWYEPSAAVRHHGAASTVQVWGNGRTERWQRSTYAWMLRRRGPMRTRAYALINTLGAGVRALLLTLPAILLRGKWRERWRLMAFWTRVHLQNLLASDAVLREHR